MDSAELFIVRPECSTMNDSDYHDEIVRLEAQIDELAARIESCRKFILAGRIAVAGGGAVLIAMLVGVIQFDPSVMALTLGAVLGGIVVAGSNRSTAKEAEHELTTAEANRKTLIEQINFPLVSGSEDLQRGPPRTSALEGTPALRARRTDRRF
jgi:hypothetical protein